jgi:hypothetical protein
MLVLALAGHNFIADDDCTESHSCFFLSVLCVLGG